MSCWQDPQATKTTVACRAGLHRFNHGLRSKRKITKWRLMKTSMLDKQRLAALVAHRYAKSTHM